jgi:hypothetical protein
MPCRPARSGGLQRSVAERLTRPNGSRPVIAAPHPRGTHLGRDQGTPGGAIQAGPQRPESLRSRLKRGMTTRRVRGVGGTTTSQAPGGGACRGPGGLVSGRFAVLKLPGVEAFPGIAPSPRGTRLRLWTVRWSPGPFRSSGGPCPKTVTCWPGCSGSPKPPGPGATGPDPARLRRRPYLQAYTQDRAVVVQDLGAAPVWIRLAPWSASCACSRS